MEKRKSHRFRLAAASADTISGEPAYPSSAVDSPLRPKSISTGGESPTNPTSPLRLKPFSNNTPCKLRKQNSADELQIRGGLWPSAKKPGPNAVITSLQDHLINDSKFEEDRPIATATHTASTFSSRRRAGSDSPALENNINIASSRKGRRYRSSKKPGTPPSPTSSSSSGPLPSAARLSVDENALARRRSVRSDIGIDFPSTESDRSEVRNSSNRISRAPIKISKVTRRSGSPVRRSKSPVLRNSRSPVLHNSRSPVLHNSRSPVLRRSGSPAKGRSGGGMGNIISMGLGSLFRRKSFSGTTVASAESSSATATVVIGLSPAREMEAVVESPARGTQAAMAAGELQHKLRIAQNNLMQWRFANGRMVAVNGIKWATAEKALVSAWLRLLELQVSVAQKRLQLAKQKLSFKLNTLISPQIKTLERWGNMEKHHMEALSSTKNSLHAIVCRLPLTDRAKADPQLLSIFLRKATNLMSAINGNIATCNFTAQRTASLVAELAKLLAREKSLIEECFELLGLVSKLQFQEESLRCHLIQLKSLQWKGELQ